MADYSELLNTIKQAATEAVEAGNPVNVCFGKVIDISPLKILVDQKLTLGESQLILCRSVTDYVSGIDGVDHVYGNKLAMNEDVIMLRMQGGQKYIVLDRIGGG